MDDKYKDVMSVSYDETYKYYDYVKYVLDKTIQPLGHQVLFLLPIESKVSRGGIIIPENADDSYNEYVGTLVTFGDYAFKSERLFPNGPTACEGWHVTTSLVTKKMPVTIPAFEDQPELKVKVTLIDDCTVKGRVSFRYLLDSLKNPWR